jgi:hypothetical protein
MNTEDKIQAYVTKKREQRERAKQLREERKKNRIIK